MGQEGAGDHGSQAGVTGAALCDTDFVLQMYFMAVTVQGLKGVCLSGAQPVSVRVAVKHSPPPSHLHR